MEDYNAELTQILVKINKKNFKDAYEDLKQLIEISPQNYIAFNLLAQIEIKNENLNNAIFFLEKGLAVQPNSVDLLFNKALVLKLNNQLEHAEIILKEILLIDKNIFQVYLNLASIQKKLNKLDDAIINYNLAIKINKNFFQAFFNLGNIYLFKKNLDLAIENYDFSLKLNPNHEKSIINLAQCYYYKKNFNKACELFDRVLNLNPNNSLAKYNKSLSNFKLKNFKEGWALYENRWNIEDSKFVPFKSLKAKYNKESVNKNLYIWPEQGLGDEIMFSSIFNEFKNSKNKVYASCDNRLLDIFKISFPHINFFSNDLSIDHDIFDHHISSGSLFKFYRNELGDFKNAPYLFPVINKNIEKKIIDINKNRKQVIGLSWKSNNQDYGHFRSVQLKNIFDKINFKDNTIINLQYGDVINEIKEIEEAYGYKILTLSDNFNNINDLSCIINLCDYVISIDNSTVHLSGALGKKTHLLLPFYSDWRWLENSKKTYWYNNVEVYQQTNKMSWIDVLEELNSNIK